MCLAGCDNSSGSDAAENGGKTGGGKGTSNGGAAATCHPFKIRSRTVAPLPSTRSRTRIGIGEEVDLSTDPPTDVTWLIDGDDGKKGMVTQAAGQTSQYVACDRKKSVAITAESDCGRTDTITFDVVQPTAGQFGAKKDACGQNAVVIRVGFQAKPAMVPTDVSFYNCEMKEGVCKSVSSGPLAYRPEVEHEASVDWVPFTTDVTAAGTELIGPDDVFTQNHLSDFPIGAAEGRFSWPIPWYTQVRGGGTSGQYQFETSDHKIHFDPHSRDLLVQKSNRKVKRTVPG